MDYSKKDITARSYDKEHKVIHPDGTISGVENNTLINKGKNNAHLLKTEKIVAATYLVTNISGTEESVRERVRARALELLSLIYSASSMSFSERFWAYEKIISVIGEIQALLFLSLSLNLISEMNHSILRGEYNALKETVEQRKIAGNKELGGSDISPEFFNTVRETGKMDESFPRHVIAQYPIKDNLKDMSFRLNKRTGVSYRSKTNIKMPIQSASDEKIRSDRRSNIIKLIHKKGNVNVKDISLVMPDCSEKTIQRELLSMVTSGVLKKEGEKRWSRYSLI